jgi:hypothetical protein
MSDGLLGRVRLPSRLFFYSYRPAKTNERDRQSFAAVATITLDGFNTVRSFPQDMFGQWTVVANAGKNWLFFHNLYSGAAATGLITGDRIADGFAFVQAKDYSVGALTPGYTHVAVDGRGYLLLAVGLTNGRTQIGFAQVLDDGTFVHYWASEIDIPAPDSLRGGASLVGLSSAHAWLSSKRGVSTVFLVDIKHGKVLSSRKWRPEWDGMVFHLGALLLYNTFGQRFEICAVDENQQLVTTATLGIGSTAAGISSPARHGRCCSTITALARRRSGRSDPIPSR